MTALIWPATALLMTAMLSFAGLRAWRGWLDLKRLQTGCDPRPPSGEPDAAARIEMAAVKERLRRLEAIATGVDL